MNLKKFDYLKVICLHFQLNFDRYQCNLDDKTKVQFESEQKSISTLAKNNIQKETDERAYHLSRNTVMKAPHRMWLSEENQFSFVHWHWNHCKLPGSLWIYSWRISEISHNWVIWICDSGWNMIIMSYF